MRLHDEELEILGVEGTASCSPDHSLHLSPPPHARTTPATHCHAHMCPQLLLVANAKDLKSTAAVYKAFRAAAVANKGKLIMVRGCAYVC